MNKGRLITHSLAAPLTNNAVLSGLRVTPWTVRCNLTGAPLLNSALKSTLSLRIQFCSHQEESNTINRFLMHFCSLQTENLFWQEYVNEAHLHYSVVLWDYANMLRARRRHSVALPLPRLW